MVTAPLTAPGQSFLISREVLGCKNISDNTMASYTHEKNDYREPGVSKLPPWTRMRLRNPR